MGNQPTKQHHQVGGSKPKKFVHWKSAEPPSPPGRPILIPISDQQPDVITLRWDRPKSDGGSPVLGYIIEHRRLGSPHWVRAVPILVTRTEISISGLEPGWRYQFRGIAENVVGRSNPSELSDALTVTLQRNAITVPRFLSELKDTIAVENQRVEMRIAVIGQPTPEINWFKDGFEIFSSRRTKIVNDNDMSVLIIHQTALTDEGEIKCTATNRAGHVATRAILKVEAPPKIRLPRQYEDGLIVEADEILRLKISIAGQPIPVVFWSHEGEHIKNGGRYELITTDKYSSLKIDHIKRADRGEFSIRAMNKLGEDIASFLVTVTARPDPPGKVKLKMSFGRSATLTWIAPIDDGGCKIGNYIVEYYRIGWDVWLKAATTRQLTSTLHDLIEGSEYKFRVKAENPYGLSDPSEESEVLFIPDPKRGITQPIRYNEIKSEEKPIPPKRKTLSPLRNFLGGSKKIDDRDKSPNGRISSATNTDLFSEIYESEEMHREMSYGTPDKVLKHNSIRNNTKIKNINRSPSPSRKNMLTKSSDGNVERSPSPKRKDENSLSVNKKIQQFFQRSPSPSRKILPIDQQIEQKNLLEVTTSNNQNNNISDDERKSPSLVRRNSGRLDQFNQKVQQFFQRSPSPSRKTLPVDEVAEQKNHLEVTTSNNQNNNTNDDGKTSPSLVRRNSGRLDQFNQKVQQLFRRSPSPCRLDQPSEPEADQNIINEKSSSLQRSEEPTKLSIDENLKSVLQLSQSSNKDLASKKELEKSSKFLDDENRYFPLPESLRGPRLSLPNPTIEISPPKKDEISVQSDSEKRDDIHTSSEFMLVLYPKKKSMETQKQDSFDLELEESLSPPPLSFSSPDISSESQYLLEPILRRSVSSTELLYERAMARFYEAVELEESSRIKKPNIGQDDYLNEAPSIRKRLSSISEAERLSFERRSSLRRKLSGDIPQNLASLNIEVKETMQFVRKSSPIPEMKPTIKRENTEESIPEEDSVAENNSQEYDSDYTESTASSISEDSIEKFKIELMARTKSTSGELETYHPRRMEDPNFSPYRSPTPDQSTIILNKPVPFVSSDFVPKPILKRPASDNSIKDESNLNGKLSLSPEPLKAQKIVSDEEIFTKPQFSLSPERVQNQLQEKTIKVEKTSESNLTKGIMGFFKKDKSPKLPNKKDTNQSDLKENEKNDDNEKNVTNKINQSAPNKQKLSEDEAKKKLEKSKSAEEEAKVVAEYYNDIVQEMGNSRKSSIPLYMRGGLQYDDEENVEDENKNNKEKTKPELQLGAELLAYLAKPRLSIVERLQVAYVQDKSKHALEKPREETIEKIKPLEEDKKVSEENNTFSPSASEDNLSPRGSGDNISSRGRRKLKSKVKKRETSGNRLRNNSKSDITVQNSEDDKPRKRPGSRTRIRNESNSPIPLNRRVLKKENPIEIQLPALIPSVTVDLISEKQMTSEDFTQETQEKVRSTVSYLTDVGLFMLACWVYIFKDVRLVLPILALMVYRQIGEALKNSIPDWLKRKKS